MSSINEIGDNKVCSSAAAGDIDAANGECIVYHSVYSLDFWQQVKRECVVSQSQNKYLCKSSRTFEIEWLSYYSPNDSGYNGIFRLAKEFLSERKKDDNFYVDLRVGKAFLFLGENTDGVRMEFIDWCIKKFKSTVVDHGNILGDDSPPPIFFKKNANTRN